MDPEIHLHRSAQIILPSLSDVDRSQPSERRDGFRMQQNMRTPSSPGAPGSATFSGWQGEKGVRGYP